jgi:hypothetical protein
MMPESDRKLREIWAPHFPFNLERTRELIFLALLKCICMPN